MHQIEIEIHDLETGNRQKHRCWETAVPNIYQAIVGEQVINISVDRQNVCEMPKRLPDFMSAGMSLPKLL